MLVGLGFGCQAKIIVSVRELTGARVWSRCCWCALASRLGRRVSVWAARGHGLGLGLGLRLGPRLGLLWRLETSGSGREHMAEGREPQQRGSVRPSKSPAEVPKMAETRNQTGIHLPRYFPSKTASTRARNTPTTPKTRHAEMRDWPGMFAFGFPLKPVCPDCLPGVLGTGSGWLGSAAGFNTAQMRTLLGRGGKTPFLMRVLDWDGLGVGRPDACGIADMTLASKSGWAR